MRPSYAIKQKNIFFKICTKDKEEVLNKKIQSFWETPLFEKWENV